VAQETTASPVNTILSCAIDGVDARLVYAQAPPDCPAGVVGSTLIEAVERLQADGVTEITPQEQPTDDAEPGTVVGCQRSATTTATIAVAVPATVPVPDVIGLNVEQAQAALADVGLGPVRTIEVFSDEDPGIVVGSAPPPGARLAPGSAVTLSVSIGPGVTVPDVVGRRQGQARNILRRVGLDSTEVEEPVDDPGLVGDVVSQSPQAGEQVAEGTTIVLAVGVLADDD
jgi:serine/threonine-protein kinase